MRTLSWKRLAAAGLVAAITPAALLWITAQACGPDFGPEVFVPAYHPANPAQFAKGQLGVLGRGYLHEDLVVAYRYLHGGKLSAAEQAAYSPPPEKAPDGQTWEQQQAAHEAALSNSRWADAVRQYSGEGLTRVEPDLKINRKENNYVFDDTQLNCTDGAFVNATATLQARAKSWGAKSADLQEWIRGQDAVFSNCSSIGQKPDAAHPAWPLLLRQDRAYQTAAAEFYAQDFDAAVKDFEGIGRDTASPWSRWGEYLAARAEVRKASATGKSVDYGQADFNLDLLKAAQTRLLRLERTTNDPQIRHAAEDELGFIDVRLDPGARLTEVSERLAGAIPDADFRNDMTDLDVLLDRRDRGAKIQSDAELVRWIDAWRAGKVGSWNESQGLPWLVAALAAATQDDAHTPALLAAAAKVPPSSPAYVTVEFQRARLLLAEGKTADGRALTTTVLAGLGKDDAATRNALLAERMSTARTLDEFLSDTPRTLISSGSSAAELAMCSIWKKTHGCLAKLPDTLIDQDGAAAFNQQLSLTTWAKAARDTALPQNLRQSVAWAAWLRALGLGNTAMAKQLTPLLPEPVGKTVGDSDGFPATLALLRNPGLRPYLQQGVQRSTSFSATDELRDNWWCGKWGVGEAGDGWWGNQREQPAKALPTLLFLSASDRAEAASEQAKLNQLPVGAVWLGQRAIDYVKTHPQDKDAAEALALTVRATHYSCSGQSNDPAQQAVSKEAFQILHSKYPKSEWALKTKYYY